MSPAETLTRSLPGGRWTGSRGTALCPAHDDSSPSLSIADGESGGVVVHCFAGCDWRDVRDVLQGRGLLPRPDDGGQRDARPRRSERPRRAALIRERWSTVSTSPPPSASPKAAQDAALIAEMWAAARPCAGSLAESYLVRWRGVGLPQNEAALRYHPRAPISADGARRGPGMVALVIRGDLPANAETVLSDVVGMQVTPLQASGEAVKIRDPKGRPRTLRLNFGSLGGAVRLAHMMLDPCETLAVAEGTEDALGFYQLTGYPCWATLGRAGLAAFVVPSLVTSLVIAADHDDAGREAADALAGRVRDDLDHVEALWPLIPPGARKRDWADVAKAQGARHVA